MKTIITIGLVAILIIVNGFILWSFVRIGSDKDNE